MRLVGHNLKDPLIKKILIVCRQSRPTQRTYAFLKEEYLLVIEGEDEYLKESGW
jgi:hypothetical protein